MAFLTNEDILFHIFALVATVSALLVIFLQSPIYSSLFLALTMSILGVFFFMLDAPFVAVAQVTVYAGAVMVLFIMVVMLFDLNREHEDILKGSPILMAKVMGAALLCGFLIGIGWLGLNATQTNSATVLAPTTTAQVIDKSQPIPLPAQVANPDEDLTAAEANNLVDSKAQETKVAPEPPTLKVAGEEEFGSTRSLSEKLFSKYIFAFEAVSLLLLVAIVGAVALAKSKGGTHHVAR